MNEAKLIWMDVRIITGEQIMSPDFWEDPDPDVIEAYRISGEEILKLSGVEVEECPNQ